MQVHLQLIAHPLEIDFCSFILFKLPTSDLRSLKVGYCVLQLPNLIWPGQRVTSRGGSNQEGGGGLTGNEVWRSTLFLQALC